MISRLLATCPQPNITSCTDITKRFNFTPSPLVTTLKSCYCVEDLKGPNTTSAFGSGTIFEFFTDSGFIPDI